MTDGIQRHISSLMQDRPKSFCIISDNALSLNNSEAMSTKQRPRRAKSTDRPGAVIKAPFSRTRSAPHRIPKRFHSVDTTDDLPTSNSRWSSVPETNKSKSTMTPPQRRGLSKDGQEQLQKLASSRQQQKSLPPTKPMRKLLDDEETALMPESMSLACCIAHGAAKRRTKGVRAIRRPTQEKRRNIVDILDAALGSLDMSDDTMTISTF
ncbi:expressed unknown protein [Seminavis robusta]|uniref:Uncharacterized protein n=1 Tax=Seminavis robusta TaxID=568900 RepID=A0A9N8F3G3_9STRA|nr:expressed unknown protein [Seminavis robusta]|eukprot:Sro2705_g335180.1 n/a (209) ;mRNA; f:1926-2552